MAKFARLNGLNTMKLTPTLIALTISLMAATSSVHAEKYCKSIDQSGNASYTLAPETGCKKQFKTVGVSQFKPAVVAAPLVEKTEHSETNQSPAQSPAIGSPAPTPAMAPAPIANVDSTSPVRKS